MSCKISNYGAGILQPKNRTNYFKVSSDTLAKTCARKPQAKTPVDLSDNWKMCAIGERIKLEGRDLNSIKDLSPEAIKLGYDFSVAMQERDNQKTLENVTQIEKLPTIWRSGQ